MKRQYHKALLTTGLLLLPLLLSHCSRHHLEINQGNSIKEEKVAQLKTGMTTQQVEFLLGTPLIKDPFHHDRWDYVYQVSQGKNNQKKKHVMIIFENKRLKTYQETFTK